MGKTTLEKIANFLHEIITGMLLGLRVLPFPEDESLQLPCWKLLWAFLAGRLWYSKDSVCIAASSELVMGTSGEAAALSKSSVSLSRLSVLLNFIDFFHL